MIADYETFNNRVWFIDNELEPYTDENPIVSTDDTKDETKGTTEEKELNLSELLKGCRHPKIWRAEKGEYWLLETDLTPTRQREEHIIFDDDNYEAGNYFRTQEEAARAAEVVREALAKFHQENAEK